MDSCSEVPRDTVLENIITPTVKGFGLVEIGKMAEELLHILRDVNNRLALTDGLHKQDVDHSLVEEIICILDKARLEADSLFRFAASGPQPGDGRKPLCLFEDSPQRSPAPTQPSIVSQSLEAAVFVLASETEHTNLPLLRSPPPDSDTEPTPAPRYEECMFLHAARNRKLQRRASASVTAPSADDSAFSSSKAGDVARSSLPNIPELCGECITLPGHAVHAESVQEIKETGDCFASLDALQECTTPYYEPYRPGNRIAGKSRSRKWLQAQAAS